MNRADILNKLVIRKAKKEDIQDMVDLGMLLADHHKNIDPKFYSSGNKQKASFQKYLPKQIKERNSLILIAILDNKTIGFCSGYFRKTNVSRAFRKFSFIENAFVEAHYRKLGIGRLLVNKFLDWSKKKGAQYVDLTVDARNMTGVKAWERMGFETYLQRMRMKIEEF